MDSPQWRQRLAPPSPQPPLWCPHLFSHSRKRSKPSPFLLCLFTFLLILFFSLSWVSAKEAPKSKIQPWQMDGIIAALDDGYSRVKIYALNELAAYNQQNLKSLGKKTEEIAHKAAEILKVTAEFGTRQQWAVGRFVRSWFTRSANSCIA